MAGLCPTSATQTTQTTAGLSPWSQPYVSSMLGAAQQQVFNTDPKTGQITGFVPYLAYGAPVAGSEYKAGMGPGEQAAARASVAGPNELQYAAYASALGMGLPSAFGDAQNYLKQGIASLGNIPGVSAGSVSADQIQAAQSTYKPNLQQYQMDPYERIADPRSMTEKGALEGYISPYMQKVVDVQAQEAKRQAGISQQAQQAQAARSGMFGGSGAALQRAQANAQLQRDLQGIQASGSQAAYQQAVQQFNAEQKARMEAALANQRAGIDVGSQNLAAKLAVQKLGVDTELAVDLANMNNRQQAAVANQAAKLQAAGMNQTAALNAAIANQRSKIDAAQAQMTGASQLGALGNQELAAQQSIANLQNLFGQQLQANDQAVINQAMKNFEFQKMYPQQQLQFLSGLLSGMPVSSQGSVSQIPGPNLLSQIGGLGIAGAGAYGLYNKLVPGGKKGGAVKSDPTGGIVALGMSKALKQ